MCRVSALPSPSSFSPTFCVDFGPSSDGSPPFSERPSEGRQREALWHRMPPAHASATATPPPGSTPPHPFSPASCCARCAPAPLPPRRRYVRNTTARAFSVVASALGIPALLPFLKAVCQSEPASPLSQPPEPAPGASPLSQPPEPAPGASPLQGPPCPSFSPLLWPAALGWMWERCAALCCAAQGCAVPPPGLGAPGIAGGPRVQLPFVELCVPAR